MDLTVAAEGAAAPEQLAAAAKEIARMATSGIPWGLIYAALGAGIAVFLGAIGSSIGVGLAGKQAAGVLSEDPDKFGKLLLLVALPGTQGVYGILMAFLIMLKVGFLGTLKVIPLGVGLQLLMAALPVGVACLISGIHQGKVCAAGASMTAKRPEALMKAIIYGAMVETYAIFGLVIGILLLIKVEVPG